MYGEGGVDRFACHKQRRAAAAMLQLWQCQFLLFETVANVATSHDSDNNNMSYVNWHLVDSAQYAPPPAPRPAPHATDTENIFHIKANCAKFVFLCALKVKVICHRLNSA